MTRYIKMSLVFFVAFWGFSGALFNVEHAVPGVAAVHATIAMEGTIEGRAQWRAIDSEALSWFAYGVITLVKLATGVLCLIGTVNLWRARSLPAAEFHAAKAMAILGCGLMLVMLFSVFIAVGEGYFLVTQSSIGEHALPTAFRYFGTIGIILVFLLMADPD